MLYDFRLDKIVIFRRWVTQRSWDSSEYLSPAASIAAYTHFSKSLYQLSFLPPVPPLPLSFLRSQMTSSKEKRSKWHLEPLLGTVTEKKEECPSWIAKKLSTPASAVTSLEIFSGFDTTFRTVARYLELVAVNGDAPPPDKIDALAEKPAAPGPQRKICSYSDINVNPWSDDDPQVDYIVGLGNVRARTSGGDDVFASQMAFEQPIKGDVVVRFLCPTSWFCLQRRRKA